MLTSDQIEALRDRAGQITDPIVEYLLEDIAQRVSEAGQFTSTASYEAWRLQNLGLSQRDIRKEIQQRLKVSKKQANALLTQAAEVGYRFDMDRFPTKAAILFEENASLQQIVSAITQQADEDLTNITQTLGFVGTDGRVRELTEAYQQACDFAFEKVVTGAQDYNSAIRDALRGLSKEGIRTIDYASGRHRSVEAAVRANIMGGLNLMEKQISEKNHDDLGCDGWEISAHAASAPDHEPFQGKQYSDAEYKAINDSLARGIGEFNCGHSAFPIILGVNSPQYAPQELEQMRQDNEKGVWIDGQHYTKYEATQRQRRFEREIRFQKHRVLICKASGDDEKLQNDQIRLVRLRQEYNRFCKAADLRPDYARQEAAGFTWKEGREAEGATREAERATHQVDRKQESVEIVALFTEEATDSAEQSVAITNDSGIINAEARTKVYRMFHTGDEVDDFFYYDGDDRGLKARKSSLHGKWLDGLSEEERAAISWYAADGYGDINDYWRRRSGGGRIPADVVEDASRQIDTAISKFELKENITVQRGVGDFYGRSLVETQEWNDIHDIIGMTFHDLGYGSATVLVGNSVATSKPVLFEIDIPAGKGRGAYINKLAGQFEGAEYEFLIARDSKFVITDVTVNEEAIPPQTIIKMRMIVDE